MDQNTTRSSVLGVIQISKNYNVTMKKGYWYIIWELKCEKMWLKKAKFCSGAHLSGLELIKSDDV